MLKPIKGWEGLYEIDDFGNIFSIRTQRFLKQVEMTRKYKYLTVCLSFHQNYYVKAVHRLVAETFLEKPKGKVEVNHKDGNRKNNHVSNLEWISHAENMRHAAHIIHTLNPNKGEKHPMAKLDWEKIIEIRALCKKGIHDGAIGKIYGVSRANIQYIRTYKLWKAKE